MPAKQEIFDNASTCIEIFVSGQSPGHTNRDQDESVHIQQNSSNMLRRITEKVYVLSTRDTWWLPFMNHKPTDFRSHPTK